MASNDWTYDWVVQDALKVARARNLDLSSTIRSTTTKKLRPQVHYPEKVSALTSYFQEAGGWPEALPLPVVAFDLKRSRVEILGGNHRIATAKLLGLLVIPAIAVSRESYKILYRFLNFDWVVPSEEFINVIAASGDEVMRENILREMEWRGTFEK